jgi:hypothetical protein
MVAWLLENELGRVWNQTVVACFDTLSRNFLAETEEKPLTTVISLVGAPAEI